MSDPNNLAPPSLTSDPQQSPHTEPEPVPETLPGVIPEALSTPLQNSPLPPRDDVFWGWHDLCLFVFITVLSLGLAMLAGIGIRSLFHISEPRMNIVFVIAQFAAYGVSFTCLKLMFHAEYDEPLLKSLHWRSTGIDPSRLVLIGLGQAFTISMIGALMRFQQLESPMNRLLSDRPTAIVIAILGVTIAPLAEELAFRGLLQPMLVRSLGVVPGILITSFLFGLMHLEQYGAWQSVLLITLAGAGFGTMRQWSGSTRASAIMHAGYNSALFILFFTQKGPIH